VTGSRPPVDLVQVLVCPTCRGELIRVERGLGCAACRVVYPLVDGVAWMDPALAVPLERSP
jgi:uncharacterized protein YbaR (Trm112 family)